MSKLLIFLNRGKPSIRERGLLAPCLLALLATALLFQAATAAAAPSTVRIAVDKKRIVVGNPPTLLFLPISSPAISVAGFTQLADYATRTVYDGPTAAADGLRASLQQAGLRSNVASDLERVTFHGYQIDPDTGSISPVVNTSYTPKGTDGLYFLVLRSYPLDDWLTDLDRRNVRRLTELPPAAYIVRCARSAVATLAGLSYVRGIFPVLPSTKLAGLASPPHDASPYRTVVARASVETAADSLRTYLQSVARDGAVTEEAAGRATRYQALITDVDAQTLSQFDLVYEIVADDTARPSSERQAMLVAQTGQQSTLPATNNDYNAFLAAHFTSTANTFDNTIIGVMDTGFDNFFTTNNPYSGVHPDFRFTFGGTQQIVTVLTPMAPSGTPSYEDRDYHGTMVTSVITGYPGPLGPPGPAPQSRAEPESVPMAQDNNYRYGLGVAPTVRCVPDKVIQCSAQATNLSISLELSNLAGVGVSVANLSFNDGGKAMGFNHGKGCGYGQKSQDVDSQTRGKNILSVIAAGNSTEGCSDNYVRTPATAKNGIAVGSTDNFTIAYRDRITSDPSDLCAWDTYTAQRDATRIPSYSAHGYPTPTTTVVKPDLVAPSTRVTGPVSTATTANCILKSAWCSYDASTDTAGFVSYTDPTYNGGQTWYYGLRNGTSFAAPVVSGAAAVVRKWYRNLLGGDPSPAMTKAVLINGARDIFPTIVRDPNYNFVASVGHIPDPYQGWGMVSFERLLGSLDRYFFYDQGLALAGTQGGVWQKYLFISNGQRDTRVTLVWTDPAGNQTEGPNDGDEVPPPAATNNLDLLVTNSAGTTAWSGNQLNQGFSIPFYNLSQIPHDSVNNVEQVIIPAGTFASGASIIVAATASTPVMSPQDFAVFIDNATEPPTTLTTMNPCRLVDTRNPDGPFGGPAIQANLTRTFPVWGYCGVPTSAKSIVLNATVTQTGAIGTMRLFPGGISPPFGGAGGVVYYVTGQTRAGNSIVALGGTGTVAVRADQADNTTTHLIIDIVGYYQ